ncbi:hypothetical protein CDA09_06980 [Azoarcus sp. DN11]|nr:hypothetical protein CDA09_06980 [Azoarcus sp. DN11]
MDHTELDIELVSLKTGKSLGRPWLSLAIDAFTRRIVGIYLSFDPPSYRSNMMLLRDIVRRHRRLPQFIVVDNGADFRSEDFKHFAELMRIHVRYCPAGNPRHGSVMERIFGRIHTEYIHNLAGNTNREGCAPSGSANQSSGISVASRACRRRASNGRPGWPNSRAWHHWTVTPWPLGAPCWASRAWRRNPTVGARAAWPRTKPTTLNRTCG